MRHYCAHHIPLFPFAQRNLTAGRYWACLLCACRTVCCCGSPWTWAAVQTLLPWRWFPLCLCCRAAPCSRKCSGPLGSPPLHNTGQGLPPGSSATAHPPGACSWALSSRWTRPRRSPWSAPPLHCQCRTSQCKSPPRARCACALALRLLWSGVWRERHSFFGQRWRQFGWRQMTAALLFIYLPQRWKLFLGKRVLKLFLQGRPSIYILLVSCDQMFHAVIKFSELEEYEVCYDSS